MGIETKRRDAAEHLGSTQAVLAYLEAAFEDGDAGLIAAALNDVAQARGLPGAALTGATDLSSVIATLKALGLELTAKAACWPACPTLRRVGNASLILSG